MSAAERIKDVEFTSMEARISLLENLLERHFDRIENNFLLMERKIEKIDKKFDYKYESFLAKHDANKKWLIGIFLSILFPVATLGFSIYSFIHKFN